MTGRLKLAVLAVAVLALSIGTYVRIVVPRHDQRRECPHDWIRFRAPVSQTPWTGPTSVTRDIPEFNDCQRFIVRKDGGRLQYDALFAIFAFDNLDSLQNRLLTLDSLNGSQPPGSRKVSIAAAYIYAEGDYDSLGISVGGNCLMVWLESPGATTWRARMRHLDPGVNAATCGVPTDPNTFVGTDLTVHRPPQAFGFQDFPPVARWDFDDTPKHEQQYIGVKCGAAWCEVGASSFHPSPPLAVAADLPHKAKRVRSIKGWYDRQYLATVPEQPEWFGTSSPLVPTTIRGTFIPDPDLDIYTWNDFKQFKHVGSVLLEARPGDAAALQKYNERFGLEPGPRWNELFVCYLTSAGCGEELTPPTNCPAPRAEDHPDPASPEWGDPTLREPNAHWIIKIVSAGTQQPSVHCTMRFAVPANLAVRIPGGDVPGTVRWRWLASDEGFWNRCSTLGCCDTTAE